MSNSLKMKRGSVLEKKTGKLKNPELPISYHTFIYPFTYEEDLEEWIAKDTSRWMQIHLCNVKSFKDCPGFNQRVLEFNEYQYFLPKARALLFDEKGLGIHRNVTDSKSPIYKYNMGNNEASYSIIRKIDGRSLKNTDELLDSYKNNKGYYVTVYGLRVNQVTLQLFPRFKTGIFTFELEYYSRKKNYGYMVYTSGSYTYRELNSEETDKLRKSLVKEETVEQEVNVINNYGRRVCIPCLGIQDDNSLKAFLNADRIVISGLRDGDEDTVITVDFDEQFRGYECVDFEMPVDLISRVLFRGGIGPKRYNVKPVLDDRMYTACLFRKNNYLPLRKTYSSNLRNNVDIALSEQYGRGDTYRYLEPAMYRDEADELYKFVFLEDDITCCNIHMLKEKLEEHVLGRWIDYGTVHAATEYSLVCVTGEDPDLEKKVINPFLSSYVDMVKLALAQRAIITKIEDETQRISRRIKDKTGCSNNTETGTDLKSEELLNDVESLWQEYIEFENQIYLPEVTFQEQGVELYDLIKRSLRIKELNSYLKDEILNMHNLVTLKAERRRVQQEEEEERSSDMISRNLSILSVVGISLALITFVVNFISAGQLFVRDSVASAESNGSIKLILAQAAGMLLMMYFFYHYYKKKLIHHSESWKSRIRMNNTNQHTVKDCSTGDRNNKDREQILRYIIDIWWIPIVILIVFLFIIVYLIPCVA